MTAVTVLFACQPYSRAPNNCVNISQKYLTPADTCNIKSHMYKRKTPLWISLQLVDQREYLEKNVSVAQSFAVLGYNGNNNLKKENTLHEVLFLIGFIYTGITRDNDRVS